MKSQAKSFAGHIDVISKAKPFPKDQGGESCRSLVLIQISLNEIHEAHEAMCGGALCFHIFEHL